MSPRAAGNELERAFLRFEKAATSLEEHHASLRREVDRLERELIDAKRRLEAVIDAVDSGVAVVARDGSLLRTNPALERLGAVNGCRELRSADLAALIDSADTVAGSTRLHLVGNDGEERDLAASLVPVGDVDGTRVMTIKDVTEIRREHEEGGRRQRLEALGRMAAELAHEVRNPLGSIRLFAGMLLEDLAAREGQRVMIEQILAATAGLEGTVSNLLAFASPSRGQTRELDAAQLAREACSLLAPACAVREVKLEGPPPSQTCRLDGDPEGIRQILLNLIGNALAATRAGGRIVVTTRREGDRVRIAVTDDGAGIAAEDLPRVFDPFFSRTEGGTGLGLSIVHGIVERHGGRIALESGPGRGTEARVELPARPESRRQQEERQHG